MIPSSSFVAIESIKINFTVLYFQSAKRNRKRPTKFGLKFVEFYVKKTFKFLGFFPSKKYPPRPFSQFFSVATRRSVFVSFKFPLSLSKMIAFWRPIFCGSKVQTRDSIFWGLFRRKVERPKKGPKRNQQEIVLAFLTKNKITLREKADTKTQGLFW